MEDTLQSLLERGAVMWQEIEDWKQRIAERAAIDRAKEEERQAKELQAITLEAYAKIPKPLVKYASKVIIGRRESKWTAGQVKSIEFIVHVPNYAPIKIWMIYDVIGERTCGFGSEVKYSDELSNPTYEVAWPIEDEWTFSEHENIYRTDSAPLALFVAKMRAIN